MRSRLTLLTFLILTIARHSHAGGCADWATGPLGGENGASSSVLALTTWDPDGAGPLQPMLVAGGIFASIEGVPVARVAARDPVTGTWQSLGSSAFPALVVDALTVHNGELIAAGSFTQLGGQSVNRIARWDGATWQPLGNGIDNGEVRALGTYNGDLIAAGTFTSASGQAASNIARWNGSSWQPLGTGTDAIVLALGTYNGELIAGGSFTQAGGQANNRIARWNGSVWQSLSTGMNTSVYALKNFGSDLIASGAFTTAGGTPANYIARWNGASWQPLGSGTDNAIRALTIYGADLIAAGVFTVAGGIPASCVARWNGLSWSTMHTGISGQQTEPFIGGPDVFALTEYSGEVIAGGVFTTASSQPALRITRWNGSLWSPFGGGSVTSVLEYVDYNGRLVAGGNFNHATSGQRGNYIVGWDGVKLTPFGTGMNAVVTDLESFKYAGSSGDYELIAGGSFTFAGGVAANRIARWQEDPISVLPPPAWQPMGAGFDNIVWAIERFNGATYAAGAFTFSSSPVSRIARWNETTGVWEPLGTGMNGTINDLKSHGGFLYAGGAFTTAGGVSTGGLARWDGSVWSQVSGVFNGTVQVLESHNGDLVIGGLFPAISGSANLVRFDGLSFSAFGAAGTNDRVRTLASLGGHLYVGGAFTTAGGIPADHLARWNGTAWSEVSGGPDTYFFTDGPTAMKPYRGEIHVGGGFETAEGGLLDSPGWVRYVQDVAPWIAYHPTSQTRDPGQSVVFTATAAAGYAVTYQWHRNGYPIADGPTGTGSTISGATATTVHIINLSGLDAGNYHAVVTDGCGSDTSAVATLTVTGPVDAPGGDQPSTTWFETLRPNPSPGPTTAVFALARDARVRVGVHDVAGRLIRLMDAGTLAAGRHRVSWDGLAGDGYPVRAGLYFVSLETDGHRLAIRRIAIQR